MHPVGFEPTRFGETVGLKSTPLDLSGIDAFNEIILKMVYLKVFT